MLTRLYKIIALSPFVVFSQLYSHVARQYWCIPFINVLCTLLAFSGAVVNEKYVTLLTDTFIWQPADTFQTQLLLIMSATSSCYLHYVHLPWIKYNCDVKPANSVLTGLKQLQPGAQHPAIQCSIMYICKCIKCHYNIWSMIMVLNINFIIL